MKKRQPGEKYIGRGGLEIEVVGDVDVCDEDMAKIEAMTQQADQEDDECRVNFRWTKEQLAVVKQVAAKIGVPYQAYIKQVLSERAHEDLRRYSALTPSMTDRPRTVLSNKARKEILLEIEKLISSFAGDAETGYGYSSGKDSIVAESSASDLNRARPKRKR